MAQLKEHDYYKRQSDILWPQRNVSLNKTDHGLNTFGKVRAHFLYFVSKLENCKTAVKLYCL